MAGSVIRRAGLVSAAALIACWSNASPVATTPVGNAQPLVQPGSSPLEGEYWCSISVPPFDGTETRYAYPNFPCTIRNQDRQLVLEKHGGSQRFTGAVLPHAGGFAFDGKFYCPWGACDQPLRGEFRNNAQGELIGTFSDDGKIEVRMVRAQPGAFGGAGYGLGYGGGGYGGGSYGGQMYGGGFRKPHRGRR
ncbi:MAG: hypothetical protein NT062_19210 [Proteobacteria bacterium]|nr:hypothetical protein [Pseudomonadota bacterium]